MKREDLDTITVVSLMFSGETARIIRLMATSKDEPLWSIVSGLVYLALEDERFAVYRDMIRREK